MATEIKSLSDVLSLKEINGVSLNELDRRAAPLKNESWDKEEMPQIDSEDEVNYVKTLRSLRSAVGYIRPDPSSNQDTNPHEQSDLPRNKIIQVMKQDWLTVEELKTSHIELAQHLRNLLNLCDKYVKEVVYSPSEGYPQGSIKTTSPQRFEISHITTRGFQSSLFTNLEKDADVNAWSDEYHIRNIDLDLKIEVGGNANHGVISYIEKYGFYEGGKTNPYRIDPSKLVAMLTGILSAPVVRDVILGYQEILRDQESELQETEKWIQVFSDKLNKVNQDLVQVEKKLKENKDKSEEVEEELMYLESEKEQYEGEMLYLNSTLPDNKKKIEATKTKIAKLQQDLDALSTK